MQNGMIAAETGMTWRMKYRPEQDMEWQIQWDGK